MAMADSTSSGGVQTNATTTIEAVFTEYSWETWYDPDTGEYFSTNCESAPVNGATVSFAVTSPDGGTLSLTSSDTDEVGRALVDFTATASAGSAEISAYVTTASGVSGSGTFNFSIWDGLTWSKHHDEGTLTASLTTNSTTEIPTGQSVNLDLNLVYASWEIWTTDYGDSEVRNESSSTAGGAQVYWMVTAGNGTVSQTETSTDLTGNTSVVFTMGDSATQVEAVVNYGGSSTTIASINFSILADSTNGDGGDGSTQENWYHSGQEEVVQSISLVMDGQADGLTLGQGCSLSASVETMIWDVWTSDQGGTSYSESSLSLAKGVEVVFSMEDGDGTLSATSAVTDANGVAFVTYTMGASPAKIRASIQSSWYGEISSNIDLSSLAEEWMPDGTESVKSLGVGIDGSQQYFRVGDTVPVFVSVSETTREWEVSNYGNRRIASETTQPCSGASVTVSGDSGGFGGSTGGDGMLYGSVSVGQGGTTLTAFLNDGTSSTFSVAATDEVWADGPQEGVIEVTLTSSGPLSEVVRGSISTLAAKVDYRSWDLQSSNFGGTRRVNETVAPAIGAPVAFLVSSGDGTLSGITSVADASGYATATFQMGQQASAVQVQASYQGASTTASLSVSPEEWQFLRTDTYLNVTLSQAVTSAAVVPLEAVVSYTEEEVWVDSSGHQEVRGIVTGPASNAAVRFDMVGGDGYVTPINVATDAQGRAATEFVAGAVVSSVDATAAFSGLTATAFIQIYNIDSDGDGFSDADEIAAGSDPHNANSVPGTGGPPNRPGRPPVGELQIATPSNMPSAKIGEEYTFGSLTALGGQPPYMWSVTGGELPPGLNLVGDKIQGVPTKEGEYNFTITVSGGGTAAKQMEILVFRDMTEDEHCPCGCSTCKTLPWACGGTANFSCEVEAWTANSETRVCNDHPSLAQKPEVKLEWEELRVNKVGSKDYQITRFRRLSWVLRPGSSTIAGGIGSIGLGIYTFTNANIYSIPRYISDAYTKDGGRWTGNESEVADITALFWQRDNSGRQGPPYFEPLLTDLEGDSVRMQFQLGVDGEYWIVNYSAPKTGVYP
jgi:hypothetical protein